MSKILIKNGKALIIKNNDVVIEEINILIENGKKYDILIDIIIGTKSS